MTCRHSPGDPLCSSNRVTYPSRSAPARSANISKYDIEEAVQSGKFLIMKVNYPYCVNCTFEGTKVMVFEATFKDALHWREIDPHFRDTKSVKHQAPCPVARFPNTKQGWANALALASTLNTANGPFFNR